MLGPPEAAQTIPTWASVRNEIVLSFDRIAALTLSYC